MVGSSLICGSRGVLKAVYTTALVAALPYYYESAGLPLYLQTCLSCPSVSNIATFSLIPFSTASALFSSPFPLVSLPPGPDSSVFTLPRTYPLTSNPSFLLVTMGSTYTLSFRAALTTTILYTIITCLLVTKTFRLRAWFFFIMLVVITSISRVFPC
jgi:hypothetical protein